VTTSPSLLEGWRTYSRGNMRVLWWLSKSFGSFYLKIWTRQRRCALNERVDVSFYNLTPQILWKTVPVWIKMSHPNITKFQGVTIDYPLALVYNWGERDTIMKYVKAHPEASRLTLVPYLASPTHDIIQLTPLPPVRCWKLRWVWSTSTPSTSHTGILER